MSLKWVLYKNLRFRHHYIISTLLSILTPILLTLLLLLISRLSSTVPITNPTIVSNETVKYATFGDYVEQFYGTQSCVNGVLVSYNGKSEARGGLERLPDDKKLKRSSISDMRLPWASPSEERYAEIPVSSLRVTNNATEG